ncbi:hypothetical protein SDC9_143542 [bioreactor metagenome]|uniref:Uncharacterized protein n=1 Tax=bioreactor metagenome TaxID=1076179 RepID=A0A645E4B3_9ZZZZ
MNTDLAGSALQVLSAASYGKLSDVFMKICMNYYLPDNDSALIMKQIISNAYYDAGYMLGGKALKEFGDASFEMIRSKVLFNLDFNELYKANITAFNERYSVRNLFVIKRQ